MREGTAPSDFLRGRSGPIRLRYDPGDKIEVPCLFTYEGVSYKRISLPRNIEVLEGEEWKPYPVVTWVDVGDHPEGIYTIAAVFLPGEDSLTIIRSSMGVPDGAIICAAKEKGLLTNTLDL